MSEYPNVIDSFDDITPEQPMDDHDQVHNAVASSVVAVETALGTDVAGSYENVSTRLDANDSLVGAIRSQMADFVGSQPAGEYVFADKVTAAGEAKFDSMVGKTLLISVHATDANGKVSPLATLQTGENMQVTIGEEVYDCGVNSRVDLKGEPDWQGNRSTIGHMLDLAVRGDAVPSKPANGTRLELNIKGNEDLTVEDIAEITRNSVQNAEGKTDQKLWLGTAAEYANILEKDSNTLYVYTP